MKYNELMNYVYPDDGPFKSDRQLQDVLRPPTYKAWKIIGELKDRSGFDDWWYNIDNDIQDEIFDEIVEILK